MEVMPGVHQIPINYKGRPLQLYLLRFGDGGSGGENLLMDCGDAGTPAKDILPYFEKIGMPPSELTHVLITHPDVDHTGGIHAIRAACPNAKFYCGADDRTQVETPEGFARGRQQLHTYWHGMGLTDDHFGDMVERVGGAGKKVAMTAVFGGGETLKVGDKELRILHVPGHSMGHLGVYLPWENAAIVGDAVHHRGNYYLDGTTAFAVTYIWVDEYLGTIDRLEAMRLDKLFTCHWTNWLNNGAVTRWLREARDYTLMAEGVILETVKAAGDAGLTLKEVCVKAKGGLGQWAAEFDGYTSNMASGHLQRLANRGWVRLEGQTRPVRYVFEKEWRGIR